MNTCFFIGKVVSYPTFDFLYMEENTSISCFDMLLNNNSIIKFFGYDETADYLYQNIQLNDILTINGTLCNAQNTLLVKIIEIEKFIK